jgi:GxxExxY protein
MANDKSQYLYSNETDQIIGICYKVLNALGYGHPEKVYHRSIEKEFKKVGLKYRHEAYHKIKYDNEVVGRYFLDFVVGDKIAVEVKVRREIFETDWRQLLNYLKATNLELGLLIVFSKDGIKIKRVINSAMNQRDQSA